MKMNKWSGLALGLGIFSIICLLIGTVLLGALPTIVKKKVDDQVPLTTDSWSYNNWKEPPYDIVMEFYVSDLQNDYEVTNAGVEPVLIERGPYTFREVQEKLIVNNNATEAGSIMYRNFKTYHFDKDASCQTCTLDDQVMLPNLAVLTVVNLVTSSEVYLKDDSPSRSFIGGALAAGMVAIDEKLFITKPVRSILFEGYDDNLFTTIDCLEEALGEENIFKMGQCIKDMEHPKDTNSTCGTNEIPDKIGIFYCKNDTSDGEYEIFDGSTSVDKVGKIAEWKAPAANMPSSELNYWYNTAANMINGSDGTLYHPFVKRSDRLPMFISDICRSVYMIYQKDVTVDDIDGYRFYLPQSVFNSDLVENYGFCDHNASSSDIYKDRNFYNLNSTKDCLPAGLLDLSRCVAGDGLSPIVASSPHFLYAPKEAFDAVQVQRMDGSDIKDYSQENDQSLVDVEPTSGALLHANRRLQINVQFWKMPLFTGLGFIKSGYVYPILWLNESASMQKSFRDELYSKVVSPQKMAKNAGIALLIIGAIFLSFDIVAYSTYKFTLLPYRKMKVKTTKTSATMAVGFANSKNSESEPASVEKKNRIGFGMFKKSVKVVPTVTEGANESSSSSDQSTAQPDASIEPGTTSVVMNIENPNYPN